MNVEAALTEPVHQAASDHLLAHLRSGKRQEELCFALWQPSRGAARTTALISELVLPESGERALHGNASFEADYASRALRLAVAKNAGLALLHSHPAAGWQGMSNEDVAAERDRLSGPARATGLPFVGLTLGTDEAWSARFWSWTGSRFERSWCRKVRVVGRRLRLTYHDRLAPPPGRRTALRRTIDTWGAARQADLARLRIGVVGLGSVGCLVNAKGDDTLGQASWSVAHVGPERRCLRCDGQYTTSDVVLERDGSLDDPSYIAKLRGGRPTNQNVFPFSASLASLMTLEMIRMVVGASWWPQRPGKLHYDYVSGQLDTVDEACRDHCEVRARTARGDRAVYPFLAPDPQPAEETPRRADSLFRFALRWVTRRLRRLGKGGKT